MKAIINLQIEIGVRLLEAAADLLFWKKETLVAQKQERGHRPW